jgi:hypothetical protein
MSLAKNLLAAAVATAFAAPALADNVDFLDYANGSATINYTLDYANNALDKSGSTNAGGFLTSVNGGPSFVSWCLDLYQTINFADPAYPGYTLLSPPGASFFTFNTDAYSAIGRFLAENHAVTDATSSAAFQVALWELMYETSGTYSLGGGTASFTGDAAALGLAQGWINVLDAASTPFAVYQSQTHQDILVTPVPEPETYALMAAGLGALGWVSRRRKAQAKA